MSRPNNRVNNTKIDELADEAKSAAVKVKRTAHELAEDAARDARALAKTTGEKLKAAGIKVVDLSK